MPPPPPLLDKAAYPISPELALVDRELADLGLAGYTTEPRMEHAPVGFLESADRDALIRICELSDVNPPRARTRLALAVAVPAMLWAEVVVLVVSVVPLGAL
jgi:hypothetical protein